MLILFTSMHWRRQWQATPVFLPGESQGQRSLVGCPPRGCTGDYNIVNVDFFVEYKISDPVQYLYSSNNPELILRNLIQSQIRNVVGSSTVDAVLTDGKENIQMQVKDLVSSILEEYDIGLTLVDVKIQDAEPPTQEVIEAFKAVETAKQQAETVINDAKAYQNASCPRLRPRRTS